MYIQEVAVAAGGFGEELEPARSQTTLGHDRAMFETGHLATEEVSRG
jgi:hypothetical protein